MGYSLQRPLTPTLSPPQGKEVSMGYSLQRPLTRGKDRLELTEASTGRVSMGYSLQRPLTPSTTARMDVTSKVSMGY
jgi:hypothetical protein